MKRQAFTLTELLVVIILVGILASLAIPNIGSSTDRAMELEAELALEKVHQLQKIHYLKNKRYTNDLNVLGLTQEAVVDQDGNGRARYLITIPSANENGFLARAEPQVKDLRAFTIDQDGKYQVAQ